MTRPSDDCGQVDHIRLPNTQAASRLGWALFAMALSVQAGGPLLIWISGRLFPALAQWGGFSPLLSILLPMVVGYPVFFLLARRIPVSSPARGRPMAFRSFVMVQTVAFGLGYLTNIFTQLFSGWFSQNTGFVPQNPLLGLQGGLPAPVLLTLTVVAAPVCEELVFRGMVLGRLRQWGEPFAVISSALLFALYHGNLSQLFYTFVVGLVLGYTAMRYSVHDSMLIHMCLNLPGTLILSFIDLQRLEELSASPLAALSSPGELLALLIPSLFLSLFMFGTIIGAIAILLSHRHSLHFPHGDGMPEAKKYPLFFCSTGIALFVSMHVLLIAFSLFF